MKRVLRSIAVASLLLTIACAGLFAQDTRGTITGRVTDASGAVIPGAIVVGSNNAMGTKATISTRGDGIYRAPLLSPDSTKSP